MDKIGKEVQGAVKKAAKSKTAGSGTKGKKGKGGSGKEADKVKRAAKELLK